MPEQLGCCRALVFLAEVGLAGITQRGVLLTGLHAPRCSCNQKKNNLGESRVALLQIGNSTVNHNYGCTYI